MRLTRISAYSFVYPDGTPISGGKVRLLNGTTPVVGYDADGNALPVPAVLNDAGSIDIYVQDNVVADAYIYTEDNYLYRVVRGI